MLRPRFNALRAAIREGQVAHLWTVEQSRLTRREAEWFELAAELVGADITEVHTRRDGLLPVEDEVSGIRAIMSAAEIRKLRKRVNDRLAENAALGRPAGGSAFGYRHGVNDRGEKTLVQVPDRAEAVRWAAERFLSGWSLEHIAHELRGRGLAGAHGGRLTYGSVKSMLSSPVVAGHRVHQGQIVGRGNWEPILDETTWQLCRAKLAEPRRVRRRDGKGEYEVSAAVLGQAPARRYWVASGLSRCGVCKAPLVGTLKQLHGRSVPYLVCMPHKGGKACVGITLEPAQDEVLERLWKELDKPEFLKAVAADGAAERRGQIVKELEELEGQRVELAKMWAARQMRQPEWAAARGELDRQEDELRTELAGLPVPKQSMDIDEVREAWPDLALDEQREFVRMFIERVIVFRVRPGAPRRFDGSRIKIVWRKAS